MKMTSNWIGTRKTTKQGNNQIRNKVSRSEKPMSSQNRSSDNEDRNTETCKKLRVKTKCQEYAH